MQPVLKSADRTAIQRLISVDPEWTGLGAARDLAGFENNILLHAGPQFSQAADISRPILNSACVAAVYQGLADSFEQAEQRIGEGHIQLRPAQDYNVVTPLASVVSASMQLQIIRDRNDPNRVAFGPINGGSGPAMRLGLRSDAVLERLRWLNGQFASELINHTHDPIGLIPIALAGIRAGDDCHGRTPVCTEKLNEILAQRVTLSTSSREFLSQGPSFFLNLWMAACRCMLNAAVGTSGSSLVTAAGANGVTTGIQIAGLPGRWFVHEATPPLGRFDDERLPASRALGAIGDSAIVDALGFGAMAMNYAPVQRENLGAFMPEDGLSLPDALLAGVHPGFDELDLKLGLLASRVTDTGREPAVSLGILDITGEQGRLGGGIYRSPLAVFSNAMAALNGG